MRTGTIIENPPAGQRLHLVESPSDTGGHSFTAEWTIAPRRGRDGVPPHIHRAASERFTVISGRGRYLIGKEERELGPGESVVLEAGVPHIHPWSVSDQELRYTQETTASPPNQAELDRALDALSTMFALAREGKTNAQGVPSQLQMIAIGYYIMPGTYLARLPVGLQNVLMPILAGLVRLFGYRPIYARHQTA